MNELGVEVQSGLTGFPTRKGVPDLLFDPGRSIVGQKCRPVSVVFGLEHGGN